MPGRWHWEFQQVYSCMWVTVFLPRALFLLRYLFVCITKKKLKKEVWSF